MKTKLSCFNTKTLVNKKLFGSLSIAMLGILSQISAQDITNNIYNLKNVTNDAEDIFSIVSTRTYKGSDGSFTQNYTNGTLIFGNTSQTKGDGNIWFGGYYKDFWNQSQGHVGYITANFNAKNIYLTGTLGSGNSLNTGGGATLNFVSTEDATLQDWYLNFTKAGTQHSHLTITTKQLIANNITIQDNSDGSVTFNAENFNFNATSLQGHKFVFSNTQNTNSNGNITINSLSISNGYFDTINLNDSLDIKLLNISNTSFQTKPLQSANITISNGSFTYQDNHLNATGLYVLHADTFLNHINQDIYFENLEMHGSTLDATGANGKLTIKNFLESDGSNTIKALGDITLEKAIFKGEGIGDGALLGKEFRINGENIVFGEESNLVFRNHSWFKISGKSFNFNGTIELKSNLSVSDDSSLDLRNITEKTILDSSDENIKYSSHINNLIMYVSSVYGKDFLIDNVDVRKSNSRSVFRTNIGTSKIKTLTLHEGVSLADSTVIEFREGGDSLTINTANIGSWGTIDASSVSKVTINTLISSHATIKAGNSLEIKNATFSNNQTFLEAQGNITIGNITFNNQAELHIKSGQNLMAQNLIMQNGSALVAQANNPNSNMSGDTTIKQIDFDNSRIYANNLTTEQISIKNNATIWLKSDNSGLYQNNGNLNIDDGSKLTVNGNMENTGSLNLGLKPSNTELIHTTGYFKFNMDDSEESKKFTITNIVNGIEQTEEVELSIPKSKINIYTSTKDLITGQVYTLIKADGGIQFLKDGKIYTNLSEDTKYGELRQIFAQNIYFFDKENNNNALNVNFTSNIDDNILSFSIPTTGVYVDITPFIKPGVWGFGGKAVFGIMNGAGGLAQDYTLTLEPKVSDEEATKGQEVIYYLKDYTYHNSGNTQAVFSIDATGSKFVLGKNRETAGNAGKIHIGDALSRSTMHIKADDIYLGGEIILGDGALISGHLKLESTKTNGANFIGSNDNDHTASIKIKNHSSLSAIGDAFNYQGTIFLEGNGTTSDEVTLNLSGITGNNKIVIDNQKYDNYIYKLVVRDAKKTGDSDTSGGITAKNFYISTLEVKSGNNTYNEFLGDIGESKIDNLTFKAGTSESDAATLKFKDKGTLEVNTLNLENYGRIDVSTLDNFKITNSLSATNSIITLSQKSQEVDIKNILKFENSTLSTGHFNTFGLNIASSSSFYQSFDDENGYANITITGEYSAVSSLIPIINQSHITFNKLNNLNTQTLRTKTIGAYGSSIQLNDVKNATIDHLILEQNSNADTAYPTFDARNSQNLQLTIKNLESHSAYIYANNANTTIYQAQLNNTEAYFGNLTITGNAPFNYDSSTSITIGGNLTIQNKINLNLTNASFKTINVNGHTDIYFNGQESSIFDISNIEKFKGAKTNQEYTLLNSLNGITYHFSDGESGNDEKYQKAMLNYLGFYSSNNRVDEGNDIFKVNDDFVITKTITSNSIGFKITPKDSYKPNPFDKDRIEYYLYKKGGEEWIYSLKNIDAANLSLLKDLHAIMLGGKANLEQNKNKTISEATDEWLKVFYSLDNQNLNDLQVLMIDKNNAIWANNIIIQKNLEYFQEVAQKIQEAREQLGSVNTKSSSADAVRLATDSNRINRLVKLSATQKSNYFANITKQLQKNKFAYNNLDLASLYQQAIREEYKNNIWATAIGAANFAEGRNGTLYGINIGYDRYIKNVIVGGYAAYAHSTYYGGLLQNNANNFNTGIYTRIFIKNGEFDLNASFTVGWIKEFIDSKDIITKQINQHYNYNSYITNINFNYGYLFYLQEKSFVLKPQIGLSQFFIANSKIDGKTSNVFYQDLDATANADNKLAFALNIALETRKYLSETSYWYATIGASQDLVVFSNGAKTINFIGANTLAYHDNTERNLRFSLNIGGEMEVYKRTFINLGLGSKIGVFYKDLGVSGNIGVRYVF